jgi:ATP-dependent Clp protease ATP-binding subunit ClpC
VFERFTAPARYALVVAEREARLLQHDYIGTEHLLIAATQVDDRLTAALAGLGITTEVVRGQVTRMVAPSGNEVEGQIPFTAEAKAALEGSLREALQHGHNTIEVEHVVLGLLDVHDGTMPVLLTRLGVRSEAVRTAVVGLFAPRGSDDEGATPSCGSCGAPLTHGLRLAAVMAGPQLMHVVFCGACGTVVSAWPSADDRLGGP